MEEIIVGPEEFIMGEEEEESTASSLLHLVDGDIPAYRCASATDGRVYIVGEEEFKYKKEALAYVKASPYTPEDIILEFRPEPIAHCIRLMKNMLSSMEEREIWLSDTTNFRYEINENYKADRKKKRRPHNLKKAKEYLIKHQGAKIMPNMEADDALVIRSTELDAEGIPHVIASVDKDLKQKHGTHFNLEKGVYEEISEATAKKNLWRQICTGDPTDGIYSPKGLGPKRAEDILKLIRWDKTDDFVILKGVMELYKRFTKKGAEESSKDYLTRIVKNIQLVASQVYLRRSIDDVWKLPQKSTK